MEKKEQHTEQVMQGENLPAKIVMHYSPAYTGSYYIDMPEKQIAFGEQVVDTQGLVTQLAMHAGIHQETPSFPLRLAAYHKAVIEYDQTNPDNVFHRSIGVDSMSTAKALLEWRDQLALAGWTADIKTGSQRLDDLAGIEAHYKDDSIAVLLHNLEGRLKDAKVPNVFQNVEVLIPCEEELLPDYILPVLKLAEGKGVKLKEEKKAEPPKTVEQITFSQQWNAEAWLAQQPATAYEVWINSDNKRLDNWLHMSGNPVSGSKMHQVSPQITQMFLLAIQLFKRPLDVNALVQYLLLPECPVEWKLAHKLAKEIVNQGGVANEQTEKIIHENADDSYQKFLPFDLRDKDKLVKEDDQVEVETLSSFLNKIKEYAEKRANNISSQTPDDARVAQLRMVGTLVDAFCNMLAGSSKPNMPFKTIQQWAQTLSATSDYQQYPAQTGSRMVINSPANIIGHPANVIWCDFYGDVSLSLSTDFLSPKEQQALRDKGVKLWNTDNEKAFRQEMLNTPFTHAKNKLTLVVCEYQGATKLPSHPLLCQINATKEVDGDALYDKLCTKDVIHIDNHNEDDTKVITFDAKKHSVTWRDTESYSALEMLLQNPFDYFMKYILGFYDTRPTEINAITTLGNVAHLVIERLLEGGKDTDKLKDYINDHFDDVYSQSLAEKGGWLLLPENRLQMNRHKYLLKRCVERLAGVMVDNDLTLVSCEGHFEEHLGFEGHTMINGYIDLVLKDKEDKDVIIDLKWTSSSNKFEKKLEQNRAAQLALYQVLPQQHTDHKQKARTGFFVMPEGKLYTNDDFNGKDVVKVIAKDQSDVLDQFRAGYKERRVEINQGKIETAYGELVDDLDYHQTPGVYPLELDSKSTKKNQLKKSNDYSDYNCFMQ